MNKSKFLRKSLALLLSVLMVVAMIPVGASAADKTTDLTAIYVNGDLVNVENGVFAADITSTSSNTIKVTGLYANETAKVTDEDDVEHDAVNSGNGYSSIDLSKYAKSGNVYTLPLTLKNGSATAKYTIQLTLVSSKTTVELKSVTATKAYGATINGKTINVTVPYGYNEDGKLTLTAKDSATISGTKVSSNELNNYADGDKVVVTSQSGGNSAVYTVKVTETAALTSFTVGGVKATLTHKDADTTKYSEGRSITATYAASTLVKPDTADKAPAEEFEVAYEATAGTKVEVSVDGSTYKEITSTDKKINVKDTDTTFKTGMKIKVTAKDVVATYDLVFTKETDTANTIVSATADDETVTISGTKMTVNLQKNANGNVKVVLVAPATATIAGYSQVANTTDDDGNCEWENASVAVADLKKGVVIVVKAEDGTQKQYSLTATVTGEVDNAVLKTFAVRVGTETYPGTVNENARTVSVTLPYLTTDSQIVAAKLITTTNDYVKVMNSNNSSVATTLGDLGISSITPTKDGGSATGTLYAVSKADATVNTKYTVTVSLKAPDVGNTLSSIITTSANKWNDITADNTYAGLITYETTDSTLGYITVKPSWTECQASSTALYLKSIATANGGVAFIGSATAVTGELADVLDSKKTAEQGTAFDTLTSGTTSKYIWVLTEKQARAYRNTTPATSPATADAMKYQIKIESQTAKEGTALSTLKLGDTTLGSSLTGSVAYKLTASATTETTKAFFAELNISTGASLYADVTDAGYVQASSIKLVSEGKDSTGTVQGVSATNGKLLAVRGDKNAVTLYVTKDGTAFSEVKSFTVVAENTSVKQKYPLGTISYSAPNTEAKITAFSVAGIAGSIKAEGNEGWTITVNAPLGTTLNNLVPTFTASAGATVSSTIGVLTSGETAVDFSSDVLLTVTSEDGGKSSTYTVKVTASTSFSDVKTTDWFYDNVMAAYKAGYCSGNPDGTFAPNENITRRDVAIMVYKMMGSPAVTSTASFVDVTEGDYAANAIAYLKEADIVSGDAETGKFRPGDKITRQEVASILAKAKKLSGTTDNLFKDDAKISDWAKPAVYACRAAGVFNGDDNGNFNAQDYIIRAEVATAVLQAASK